MAKETLNQKSQSANLRKDQGADQWKNQDLGQVPSTSQSGDTTDSRGAGQNNWQNKKTSDK